MCDKPPARLLLFSASQKQPRPVCNRHLMPSRCAVRPRKTHSTFGHNLLGDRRYQFRADLHITQMSLSCAPPTLR